MLSFAKTIFKTVTLITCVMLAGLGSEQAVANTPSELGIVTSELLNVRTGPDRDSTILGTLNQDALVTVIAHESGWLKVRFDDREGYIRNRPRYIRLFKEKTKKKVKRTVASAIQPPPEVSGVEREIEERAQEISEIDAKIEKHRQEIEEYSEKETVIINGLNDIDRTLNRSRRKVSGIRRELDRIEAEMKNNTNALNDLKVVIKNNEHYIERRLVALYKLQKIGSVNILASAESIYELIGRRRSMELILDADARVLENHVDNLTRLSELLNRLSEQKANQEALKDDYSRQIKITEQNRSKRQALLSEIREKKSLGLAAIASLKESARELNQTITSLDQGFGREADVSLYSASFVSRKGRLRMPVKGEIITRFGTATDRQFHVETFHSGIKVKADRGEPVQAVSAGEVLFADWLKGYGNLIIIDHGNKYYSLYGHTEELFKQKGDRVDDREVIATVGDTGSLVGPGLHFEIRHQGQPVDPLIWLSTN